MTGGTSASLLTCMCGCESVHSVFVCESNRQAGAVQAERRGGRIYDSCVIQLSESTLNAVTEVGREEEWWDNHTVFLLLHLFNGSPDRSSGPRTFAQVYQKFLWTDSSSAFKVK